MIKKQTGYLSFIIIFLILVIGFLGISISYQFSGSQSSASQFMLASQAFYLAEGGLEKATRYLTTPLLSGSATRISCAALSGNTNLTNSTLGTGTFTVTKSTGSPFHINSTLSSAITSSSTTIPVTSTTGFAPSGRVFVDREAINYSAISGNNLIGAIRGAGGTVASSHATGAYASQYQCELNALGGISNLTSPLAKRELTQAVQLQEAWAIGNRNGNLFTITHWNYPSELQWTDTSFTDSTNRENLNAISIASNAEGWATGNERNNKFTFLHLINSSWSVTSMSGACSGQDLEGISDVSSQEAWAVGIRDRPTCAASGNYRYTILKWNGVTWTELAPPTLPADASANQTLNAVHVIATGSNGIGNLGFAVGNNGQILQYNGTQWTSVASPVTNNLRSIYVVSSTEAWAVGAAGRILKWNGSSWSSVTSPTGTQLNSIAMLDTDGDGLANTGWAVGNSGVSVVYNGTSWSSQNAGGAALQGITIFSTDDVWAVGNGGRTAHWNGSAWTNIASNVSDTLLGISQATQSIPPISGWEEIFR